MRTRAARVTLALGALCAVVAAMPSAAGAASTELFEQDTDCSSRGCDSISLVVRYVAGPGEVNQPRVAFGPEDGEITVRDPGVSIEPGEGCRSLSPNEVACTAEDLGSVRLGDLDDRADLPDGFVAGGEGDDSIVAGSADGGPGDDRLAGTRFEDHLDGGPGRDVLAGGAGDDTLRDGGSFEGADSYDGGEGQDAISYAGARRPVRIDLGRGVGGGAGERDALAGFEDARGGRASDTLIGDPRPNELAGNQGDDRLRGGRHSDALYGDEGSDRADGGPGGDYLSGDVPFRDIEETNCCLSDPGRDVLLGGPDSDLIEGAGGRDFVAGGSGHDQVFGSDESETIIDNDRADRVLGGSGNDIVAGYVGADALSGGSGRDRIRGGPGRDRIDARDRTRDRVDGGRGRDGARVDRGLDRTRRVERLR